VWNFWIIYPLGAWLLILAAHAWSVYGSKPPSEDEIWHEIERQDGQRN
jgi:2TM domain